jgi:hypothetical protein
MNLCTDLPNTLIGGFLVAKFDKAEVVAIAGLGIIAVLSGLMLLLLGASVVAFLTSIDASSWEQAVFGIAEPLWMLLPIYVGYVMGSVLGEERRIVGAFAVVFSATVLTILVQDLRGEPVESATFFLLIAVPGVFGSIYRPKTPHIVAVDVNAPFLNIDITELFKPKRVEGKLEYHLDPHYFLQERQNASASNPEQITRPSLRDNSI